MSNISFVDGWPVLNPFFPSVFLPPEVATGVDVYLLAGVAGAYIWDLLNAIPQDYKVVARESRLRLPTFIYFFSKLSTFGFVVFSAIFRMAPISNCAHNLKALIVLFILSTSSTSLLFFLRARAVFLSNPLATAIFGLLWLGVLGGSMTIITAIEGVNLGPTAYCTAGVIRFYSVAGAIIPLINDSIVFFAISWCLCKNTWARPTVRNGVRTMIFGDHLPAFSKSLLQDGQVYYLTTMGANIVTVIFATGATTIFQIVCTVPNTALTNIMAGRVYRKTLLTAAGLTSHQSSSHPVSLFLMGSHDSGCSAEMKQPTTNDLLDATV